MNTQRHTAEEQYQLIMECRSSGLSDYQWCMEHDINPGTFYNWVSRLRKKACYEIPPATCRDHYKPVPKHDVVKLEVISGVPDTVFPDIEKHSPVNPEIRPSIEIQAGIASIKISNDVDPNLLSQVIRSVTGIGC